MVKSLYDRKEERLLDIVTDLQEVEDAASLNCQDCVREVDDLRKAYSALEEELDRVRSRQAKGEASLSPQPQPQPQAQAQISSGVGSPPQNKKSMSAAFVEALGHHVRTFSLSLEELEKTRAIMIRKADEVVEYFGESTTGSTTTADIFSVLLQFRRALMAAKEVVERKERMARLGQRRSASPSRR